MPAVRNEEIRRRRRRLGLKLGEFAATTGIKYQTYANIESGCQTPSIEYVYKIAIALDADATELLVNAADAA
jgi:transcriptional regulator with XRE-family HTH domain